MTTGIRIVRDYPHAVTKVWRALTTPELMALWGMRPEGYAPVVGTHFKLFGKPNRQWRGFVECEVLEVQAPTHIRYSWVGVANEKPTFVTYSLSAHEGGTRLVFEQAGYRGIGGWIFAKAMMTPGWKKVLDGGLPSVLGDVSDDGVLRPGSALKPLYGDPS